VESAGIGTDILSDIFAFFAIGITTNRGQARKIFFALAEDHRAEVVRGSVRRRERAAMEGCELKRKTVKKTFDGEYWKMLHGIAGGRSDGDERNTREPAAASQKGAAWQWTRIILWNGAIPPKAAGD